MTHLSCALVVTCLLGVGACNKAAPVDEPSDPRLSAKPQVASAALKVGRLRWDGSERAIGILQLQPRLEWQLSSSERAQAQTAYQMLVASNPALLAAGKADVWDSDKIASSESINVLYRGPSLQARQRGMWTVRVWDAQDRVSEYATPAAWEVGPWDEEVEGDWIGRASKPGESVSERERSVSYFRHAFTVPKGFKEARLYATAFGLYEMSINGKPISQDVLAPGFTDYEKRVLVQTRDVTALVRAGENVVGGVLAGGWCTARLLGKTGICGSEPPRLRVALELTLPDGKLQTIESNDDWQYAPGPLLTAHLFEGESYDARREMPGWDAPGFDARGWLPAVEYDEAIERNVYPDRGAPIRIALDRPAASVTEPSPGSYVFDLGKTIVGWARLSLEAPAGTNITLRYAEELEPDGTLKSDAARPVAVDRYTARGSGNEIWEPRFSLRQFRYVELRGVTAKPSAAAITGRPVHSEMAVTGTLTTSDESINRFFARIGEQQERAFVSVPGFGPGALPGTLLGAQLFALTSCLNRDVQPFYRKWIDDIRDAQLLGAGYGDAAPINGGRDAGGASSSAGVLVPWALYRCYADSTDIEAHTTSMGRFVDAVVAKSPERIWRKDLGSSADPLETGPATAPALLATAELAYTADALSQMLRGGAADAEAGRFAKLAQDTRAAFRAEFLLPDGKLKNDTQTAYAVAIARGALEGAELDRAGKYLVSAVERAQGRPTTGVLGTALLLPALSRVGRDDLAYALLRGFVERGARLPRGLELGAIGEWMYDAIGGIALDPAAPAGRHVLVRPRPGGQLTSARASFASLYGPIETAWALEGRVFQLSVALPVGSSATVWLPQDGAVTEGGASVEKRPGIKVVALRPEGSVLELASGRYELSVGAP